MQLIFLPLVAFGHNFDSEEVLAEEDSLQSEYWNAHAQLTNTIQWHPTFDTKCDASQFYCMSGRAQRKETNDATIYLGARLWSGAELYINTEVDEGFGLGDTHGIAGFPSGESYKLGEPYPYIRTQRLFIRHTINLGGEDQHLDSIANQLAGNRQSDNLILTVGKFSLVDIFDNNTYSHDPRNDFLNWSIVDAGAFDYAGDAWGYVYGFAGELNKSEWSVRGAFVNLSTEPGALHTDMSFDQWSVVGEIEKRYVFKGQDGKIKVLGFLDHGKMGDYRDALALGGVPDLSLVRHESSKLGMAINVEQSLTSNIGLFARFSMNDGNKETWDFTDINQSFSLGASFKGEAWGRALDKAGVAFANNDLSRPARDYFEAGGLGVLIGGGPHPGYSSERIMEAYYSISIRDWCNFTVDYQHIQNPAYNPQNQDISILGMRMHFAI